jgi:hypothetical protein
MHPQQTEITRPYKEGRVGVRWSFAQDLEQKNRVYWLYITGMSEIAMCFFPFFSCGKVSCSIIKGKRARVWPSSNLDLFCTYSHIGNLWVTMRCRSSKHKGQGPLRSGVEENTDKGSNFLNPSRAQAKDYLKNPPRKLMTVGKWCALSTLLEM